MNRLNPAQIIARATYHRLNDAVAEWFRELGGMEHVPPAFDISGEAWIEAEKEIDAAALSGEIETTTQLCKKYEKRAVAYLQAWRNKLAKKEGAAA